MSALAVFMDLKICSTIFFLLLFAHRHRANEYLNANDTESLRILAHTGSDIVKSTYELIDSVEHIRQSHINTPSFEVGYLTFTIMEVYRRMIDKYNTSHHMTTQLWQMELIMYLEDIEHHYFELDHLSSMLHEIERKFNVTSGIHTRYQEKTSAEITAAKYAQKMATQKFGDKRQTLKKLRIRKKVIDRIKPTKRTKRPSRFPLEYGWDYPDPEDLTTKI